MTDTLFFFSKSADKLAGKGSNETVNSPKDYDELNKIKDWRKILSNLYFSPFTYDGKTYNSVEHAFQAKKIELVDTEKAYWFTVDSNHKIGLGDGLVARKNRKLVILSHNDLLKWDSIKRDILKDILYQKFTQVDLAKEVLIKTKDAILLHGTRGIPIERQYGLEEIREEIKKQV